MIRIKNPTPARLPSEYQEVEYLESTGTQYIDTGFVPNQNSGVQIKLYANELNTTFNAPFGARNGNTQQFFVGLQTNQNNLTWFMRYGSETYVSTYGSKIGENLIVINKNVYTINSSSYSFPNATFNCTGDMYLFGCNNTEDTSTIREFYGRIYYCKILDDEFLVRDLVPCYRKSDNEPGMYDLANNVFYKNAGSGTFLIGKEVNKRDLNINPIITAKNPNPPKLPSEYQEVKYIESTGSQYIDTEFKPNNNTRLVLDFQHTGTTFGNVLFGARTAMTQNAYASGITTGTGTLRDSYGSVAPETSMVVGTNRHVIDKNKNVTSFDGTTLITHNAQTFTAPCNLILFGLNNNGTTSAFVTMRVYTCQLYDNGTLIRDYIPCYRKSDNAAGLYDLVNNTFYTNAGTGTFTIGNEIIYQPILEYPLKRGYVEDKLFYGKESGSYEQLVNYTMLYDLGDECTDITGGWVSKTDTTSASNNNTFARNSDNLYQKGGTTGGGTTYWAGRWFTNKKIDFADVVKGFVVHTTTQFGSTNFVAPNVCVMRAINNADSTPTAWNGGLPVSQTRACKLLNITSALASNYVSIGYVRNGYYNMYGFGLLKQDNWQELCTIAGLNSSDYTDEATLCADSTAIATILASGAAVQFMIYQCTGSFMGAFIASDICLTALNNSTYSTTIQANEHWNKFLSMMA